MRTTTTSDLAQRAGLSYVQAARFLRAIVDELAMGARVRLRGIGEFRVSEVSSRVFRTPILPAGVARIRRRFVVRFRRFPALSRAVNERGSDDGTGVSTDGGGS